MVVTIIKVVVRASITTSRTIRGTAEDHILSRTNKHGAGTGNKNINSLSPAAAAVSGIK